MNEIARESARQTLSSYYAHVTSRAKKAERERWADDLSAIAGW